ncbi:MAG: glycine cleavage system aminomethyltransferase GcvT [Bacteroidales bacterium]|nr:glycine cleavage system aminomethyltransferase GcvT [Bacteroidales bacterium]
MKKTVFNSYHQQLGAKIVPFAGFEMPVEYAGVGQEHKNVRENVGVFDVSHMGEIWIKGSAAFDLVQKLTSNDINKLAPGRIQYTCFPNENGGIVDDLLVYCYEDEKYLLVVNASNVEKDYNWIMDHNNEGATIENASDQISQLAVQGPNAQALLQKLTSIDLSGIPYYQFVTGELAGVQEVIISNSGYTGAGGFELYMYNRDGKQVWENIFKAGKELGLEPAGLAARDTLRLEMGFCLYGNDIDDATSPLEAGLGWIIKFVDGNPFISRKDMEQQKTNGLARRLVCFELQERGIPRQHYPILNSEGGVIGEVTSGTMSPMLNKGIGMGYVDVQHALKDTGIMIGIRNKQIPAVVVRPPFYKSPA